MRAGPTGCGWRSSPPTGEHPRGCGADPVGLDVYAVTAEASPRVRGRPDVQAVGGLSDRSIPAGAGPTRRWWRPRSPTSEHPRGCGADGTPSRPRSRTPGASPRVRGRLGSEAPPVPVAGSIPAGAGPTGSTGAAARTGTKHPRGCGADGEPAEAVVGEQEASPRVRGRPAAGRLGGHLAGSIPAGAGPTRAARAALRGGAKHPRGCGADVRSTATWSAPNEAFPRVRGRRIGVGARAPLARSIPAGAGPTRTWWCWSW